MDKEFLSKMSNMKLPIHPKKWRIFWYMTDEKRAKNHFKKAENCSTFLLELNRLTTINYPNLISILNDFFC